MAEVVRVWFIALCVLGIVGFLAAFIRFRSHRGEVEKKIGPLPVPAPFLALTLAAVIVATRTGELPGEWQILRLLGVGLSFFTIIMIPWTARTLGRFFIPGAAVLQDHVLITAGPFRLVRHPLLSAVLAFWMGAALGTLNLLLLALWPVLLVGVFISSQHEEKLLREKLGTPYEMYAAQTGRFFPMALRRKLRSGPRRRHNGRESPL